MEDFDKNRQKLLQPHLKFIAYVLKRLISKIITLIIKNRYEGTLNILTECI